MKNFPSIPPALIERLLELFPNRVPVMSDTDREVWAKVGEQRVLSKLRSEYARQNQTVLQGDQNVSSQQS